MTEQPNPSALRARAASQAKARLVKKHRDEYETLYREECKKVGLATRGDKNARKISQLERELERLKAKQA